MSKSGETIHDIVIHYGDGSVEEYEGIASTNLVPAGIPVVMLFNQLGDNVAIVALGENTRLKYANARQALSLIKGIH